jgi:hypothetical protein
VAAANSQTRYTLMGKAVHNGTAQGYQLEVVDDGTGKLKGQNVSIVENGRKIIGEVVGNIVYAKKRMYFKEIRVTNLRKGETQNDYCFFEINADYFIKDGRTIISGKFVGRSPNGNTCGSGDIYLMGPKSVEKIHTEYIQKIEAAKLPTIIKKITPPVFKNKSVKKVEPKIDTSATTLTLKPTEKNIFPSVGKGVSMYEYDSDTLKLFISDYDKNDGDRISLYINGKALMNNYTLTSTVDSMSINMLDYGNGTGIDTISVYAQNEGYYSPNSAKILIVDGIQQYLFYACNNYQQTKYLILRKRK